MKKAALLLAVVLSMGGFALVSGQPDSFSYPVIQIAHSGGTDKCGCHKNSKTGDYHCHKRKQRGGDCPPKNTEAEKAPEEDTEVT